MGSVLCQSFFLRFLLLPSLISLASLASLCSTRPLCHNKDRDALVHFNRSLLVANFAFPSPSTNSKVTSWVDGDCCSWDGVECDKTGHVTGLDLSNSHLYGSINSSSALFRLAHLQRLNLACNHFNYSPIPSEIGTFSELKILNLSNCVFYGFIPPEVSKLSTLTTLDLGGNSLALQTSDFVGLLQNMTSLDQLDLQNVNISSTLPNILGNLTSLTYLGFFSCSLFGEVPSSLSNLVKLTHLDLGANNFFGPTSYFLYNLTNLNYLRLYDNNFQGSVPPFLGQLSQLYFLNLADNNFSGKFPLWVANLTQLNCLGLSYNNFTDGNLLWLGKLRNLTKLVLAGNSLGGEIPSSICNITHLQRIDIGLNQLTGQIPTCLSNLTELTIFCITSNQLQGPLPNSIFKLPSIEVLQLGPNRLTGIVSFDSFSSLQHLEFLELLGSGLQFTEKGDNSSLFPSLYHFSCGGCNLTKFPQFLKHVNKLDYLCLQLNQLGGYIPMWLGNKSRETLTFLNLGGNSLIGFEQASVFSYFPNLLFLFLDVNKFQGPLPHLPSSIQVFSADLNLFDGELSPSFCNISSLADLAVSYNNLSGSIPSCLGNVSTSLLSLNLANNFFHGTIPDTFSNMTNLRTMDISSNQLYGPLPRTLVDCQMLELIDLSNNHISGKFPSWLGELPNLQVLNLRSNHLSGEIDSSGIPHGFPKLRILDLSSNNFTGVLPNELFSSLTSMKFINQSQLTYLELVKTVSTQTYIESYSFYSDLVLVNKGTYLRYWKIPNIIAAIDLSRNNFSGDIPISIGGLKMVNVLNLSNNHLSGGIPHVLTNLSRLESLDLSGNMLSGDIPQQLSHLTSLEYFNVSNNQLVGPIPQGNQFNTFDNSSYVGNPGLCGKPLRKSCGNPPDAPPPLLPTGGDDDTSLSMDWEIVVIGYGCGLVFGLIAGYWIATAKLEWFMRTFRIRQRKARTRRTSRVRRGRRMV